MQLGHNADRAIQGNALQCSNTSNTIWWPTSEAMQVALADDQILNQCKLCHLGTQFATHASGASWWPNLQSVQVAPSGDQNVQTMDETSYGGKMFYLQMEGGAI